MTTKSNPIDRAILKRAMAEIARMPANQSVAELEEASIQALRDAAASIRGGGSHDGQG